MLRPLVYLSHVVRRMRDDPTEGAEVTLLVRFPDAVDPEAAAAAVGHRGAYEGATRFGNAKIRVPEAAVAQVLDRLPPETRAVETDAVTGIAGDAGEDL